ncbi:MAG TPA: tetratricopeptide repeat protein [Blastocatellia bacterium]|nr:tetratricopeptide repeat protein [Blastocatellia bacterium]
MNRSLRGVRLALLALATVLGLAVAAHAQDADVKKYSIDVRLDPAAHAATIRTTLTVWNPTSAPKRQIQFRVNGGAEITGVSVGGQPAVFDAKQDKRVASLTVVSVQLASPIAGLGTADVTIDEHLVLKTGSLDASISPGETVLLPSSLWVPYVNTPFVQYGPNTCPVTITANAGAGERAVSGGVLQGNTFTQNLNGLPFLLTGAFDAPVTKTVSGITFEVWLTANAGPAARAGAERLLGDAERIAAYYTKVLGPAPQATFRLISSDRGAGFIGPSGIVLGRRVFLRETTDAETYEFLGDGIARIWIDGAAAVRGATPGAAANRPNGAAVIGAGMARYIAVLAMSDRFGPAAEVAAFERMRTALLRMGDLAAQVQLSLATELDPAYLGLMTTKSPLAFRIVDHEIGREAMLAGIRAALASARTRGSLTFDDVRAALAASAGRDLTALLANWFDKVVQPDLIIGVPQKSAAGSSSALRNLGTGDVTVDVLGVTASGKKLVVKVTVPSEGFGEARFDTPEAVVSVEVDPDRIIPQTDYSNDARPAKPSSDALFVQAVDLYKRKDPGGAELKLREALAEDPTDAVASAWLARALLAANKTADAERAATAALATQPVPLEASAWANNVLGQIALSAGKGQEALEYFRKASTYSIESSALITAREGIIASEKALGAPAIADPSVSKFFEDFDRAVTAGVNTVQAEQFVDSASLPDFVKGLVTSVARKWATTVMHAEQSSADEAVVDARFTVTVVNKPTNTATAIVRLRRAGGSWKIVDVQILETTDNR